MPIDYVVNIMTQKSESLNNSASDHIKETEQYIGEGVINIILVNDREIPKDVLNRYHQKGTDLVEVDREKLESLGYEVIYADLFYEDNKAPARHNSDKTDL